MEGRSDTLHDELRDQMDAAADNRDYELAARFRDRLRAIERISERQTVLRGARSDEDCIAVAVEAGRAMVAVLSIRQGRVMAMETHELEGVAGLDAAACLGAFLPQYYANVTSIPRRLLVSDEIEDRAVFEEFLAEQRGGPVEVHVPKRGDARRLIAQAAETALVALRQQRIVDDYDAAKTEALLDDLATRLQLPAPPRRIECYDISNTMGTNSVGSMVVFEEGRPAPATYRHFGIKTVEGSNDFASIEETLRRRFRRLGPRDDGPDVDIPVLDPAGANGTNERPRRTPRGGDDADLSFSVLPDLILIDGGKGQLSAAVKALREAGLTKVPGVRARQTQRGAVQARPCAADHHRAGQPDAVPGAASARRGASICDHPPPRPPRTAALRSKLDVVPGSRPGSSTGAAPSLRQHRRHPRRAARAAHDRGAATGGAAREGAPVSEEESTPEVAVTVMSFGFKFGLPADAGWVVDARMVRNPFWVPELRSFTGLDIPVRDYVLADEVARELIDRHAFADVLVGAALRGARPGDAEPRGRLHRWQAPLGGDRRSACRAAARRRPEGRRDAIAMSTCRIPGCERFARPRRHASRTPERARDRTEPGSPSRSASSRSSRRTRRCSRAAGARWSRVSRW